LSLKILFSAPSLRSPPIIFKGLRPLRTPSSHNIVCVANEILENISKALQTNHFAQISNKFFAQISKSYLKMGHSPILFL